MLRRRFASFVLLAVIAARPSLGWAQTPAPPQSLDDIPSAKREDVSRLLSKIRRRHGEDAIVIQTHLLLNAMQKGAILATGVRVERVEPLFGKRYLNFAVETGIVFDDLTRDELARLQFLWSAVLEPTLDRLKDGLQVQADGILVRMQYHHRPYRSSAELRASIDQPGPSQEAAFAVLSEDLDAVVRGERLIRDLLERSTVTVDGVQRKVSAAGTDQILTPGPN